MRNLVVARGMFRVYLRDLEAAAQKGVLFDMETAMLLANVIATTKREPVYVAEDVEGGTKRLYVIAPGGGMPQRMEEAAKVDMSRPPIRGLELE